MRISPTWLKKVAALYDGKRRDFNWRLAADGVIHHHNGLVYDRLSFILNIKKGGAAAERLIHASETALSRLGFGYLGKPKPKAMLLDAGCGRGGSCLLLAAKYPGLTIRGVTLSGYQVSAARAAAGAQGISGRVKFFKASMLGLPFDDNSFDLVWACESTEHAPDLKDFFAEMARAARNGARLVVITWVRNASHRLGRRYAALADRAYVTRIHAEKDYLADGIKSGWNYAAKSTLQDRPPPIGRPAPRSSRVRAPNPSCSPLLSRARCFTGYTFMISVNDGPERSSSVAGMFRRGGQ